VGEGAAGPVDFEEARVAGGDYVVVYFWGWGWRGGCLGWVRWVEVVGRGGCWGGGVGGGGFWGWRGEGALDVVWTLVW